MLDKLSKNVQGVIYQYLEGKELIRLECVSKKVRAAAIQDYLWRYLSDNDLKLQRNKYFNDTWRKHYWRNHNARNFMTREKFNYQMCPIRHFPEIIKCVDSYQNFVFAADTQGNMAIFLMNEEDLENENESLLAQSYSHPEGIEYVKHHIRHGDLEVVVVTSRGQIYTYEIDHQSASLFQVKQVLEHRLPVVNPQNLYIYPLTEHQLFISNYPLDGEDFLKDQIISVYDMATRLTLFSQQFQIVSGAGSDNLSSAVLAMSQGRGLNQLPMYNRFQPALLDASVTLASYKEDRKKSSLVITDGQNHLLVSLFNKSFLIVDLGMSKLEQFLKKTNAQMFTDDQMAEALLAVDIRYHKGMVIANHLSSVKIYSFVGGQVSYIENLDLQLGCSPLQYIAVDTTTDTIKIVRKLQQKLDVITFRLDPKTKSIVQGNQMQEDEKNKIQDISIYNKDLLVSATGEGSVKLRLLSRLTEQQPFYLNAGSKTIKTYKSHPGKPGVHMVSAESNKIVVVMGNLIRVYSFDFKTS